MYREQYGEYAYGCLGEEEEEDLLLFIQGIPFRCLKHCY